MPTDPRAEAVAAALYGLVSVGTFATATSTVRATHLVAAERLIAALAPATKESGLVSVPCPVCRGYGRSERHFKEDEDCYRDFGESEEEQAAMLAYYTEECKKCGGSGVFWTKPPDEAKPIREPITSKALNPWEDFGGSDEESHYAACKDSYYDKARLVETAPTHIDVADVAAVVKELRAAKTSDHMYSDTYSRGVAAGHKEAYQAAIDLIETRLHLKRTT